VLAKKVVQFLESGIRHNDVSEIWNDIFLEVVFGCIFVQKKYDGYFYVFIVQPESAGLQLRRFQVVTPPTTPIIGTRFDYTKSIQIGHRFKKMIAVWYSSVDVLKERKMLYILPYFDSTFFRDFFLNYYS